MKEKSLWSLLFYSFPFVQAYQLRKKMQQRKRKMYRKLKQERSKHLKRYLMLLQSIRRF